VQENGCFPSNSVQAADSDGVRKPSGATLSDDGEFSPQVSREFSPETAKLPKKKATSGRKFENAN
jgi:hypothetical protein